MVRYDTFMAPWWMWVAFGYVCGSIPFAWIIGIARGVDIRQLGSGNIGATNLARGLGRRWGLGCFVLDMSKGLIPVLACGLARGHVGQSELPADHAWRWLAVALAAVLGHVFPIWLRFRGGKGAATGLGAMLGIWPLLSVPALVAIITWLIVVMMFRYVSLASIVAATTPAIYLATSTAWQGRTLAQVHPFLIVTGLLAVLVLIRHRGNLARLVAGEEPKWGMKSEERSAKREARGAKEANNQ